MNLPSDLASIHEQVEVAMSHHTDGVLSPDMLSQLVTSMQAFAETYKQGAAQACPLTGQPTTRMTQVEGVTMGTETAMAYMAGQEQFVQLVEQAKQAAPANTVPASFSAEPVEEMGHLSPESQGLEPGAAAPPPPPTPTVPAPTPTVEGFLQNKVAVPPITPAPQATAATAPPATTPPPPVAAPQAGEAAAEQRDMASLIVEEVEARMQGDHGQPIPTDDGTVFYDSMANLVQQYTQWPDEQGRAFLANLATVRQHFQQWAQDPVWLQRQAAFMGVDTVEAVEARIIPDQMEQRVGQNLGDASMFMPEDMRGQLSNATSVFLESMRRMERKQRDLEEQGLV